MLTKPELDWQQGQARNKRFDDGYFSKDGGLPESRHVFLRGNHLATRFGQAASFRVGELGFGSGLNFLLTWELWAARASDQASLDYFAVEAEPLDAAQIQRMLEPWPELHDKRQQLCESLPPTQPGFHCVDITPKIRLHLLYGDVNAMLGQCRTAMDAWYLDGFAPSRNPAMWSAQTLRQVALLTKEQGSFATYTAASEVRRGLQTLGFEVKRQPGFGRKREMLCGRLIQRHQTGARWLDWPNAGAGLVNILGDGIAAASSARQLAELGVAVRIFGDQQGSSWRIPYFLIRAFPEKKPSPSHRLYQRAFEQAHGFYQRFCPDHYQPQILGSDSGPQTAGRLQVAGAIKALLQHDNIEYQRGSIQQLEQRADGSWMLSNERHREYECQTLLLCSAQPPGTFNMPLPLTPCAGQVIHIESCLTQGFAAGIHALPISDGTQIGSSFRPGEDDCSIRTEESENLLQQAIQHCPNIQQHTKIRGQFAGLRISSLDHLPLIGPAPNLQLWGSEQKRFESQRTAALRNSAPLLKNLWLNLAHGSRAGTMAPLAALLFGAALQNRPLPIEADLLDALHPGRFATRDTRRGRDLAD